VEAIGRICIHGQAIGVTISWRFNENPFDKIGFHEIDYIVKFSQLATKNSLCLRKQGQTRSFRTKTLTKLGFKHCFHLAFKALNTSLRKTEKRS
jgi:hypothetical protein